MLLFTTKLLYKAIFDIVSNIGLTEFYETNSKFEAALLFFEEYLLLFFIAHVK